MFPLRMARIGGLSLLIYVGGMAKGQHWTNECRSTRGRQGNQIPPGNSLGESFTGTDVKQGSIISSYCGEHISPGKLNNQV